MKIKCARRKTIKGILKICPILRRQSETLIRNSRILNGTHSWNFMSRKRERVHIHDQKSHIRARTFSWGWYMPLTNRVRGAYRKLRTEFFPLRFMAQAGSAWAINRRGKTRIRNLRYAPRTRLVRYLLYLYCVSEGFGNDFHSGVTASNFWSRLKAERMNLKSFFSRYHALVYNLE